MERGEKIFGWERVLWQKCVERKLVVPSSFL